MTPNPVKKSFPRQISSLRSLFDFIAAFHARRGVHEKDAREVELIVEELFTNFVRHNEGGKDVAVALERVDDTIRIQVMDEAVGEFDPTQAPSPDPSTPIEKRRAGGMGLTLVRRLAQEVKYDYHDRTSTITVVKRLSRG